MPSIKLRVALAVAFVMAASNVIAKGSPEEVAKLGNELTHVGAVKSANKDNSIPEWTGAINFTAQQKTYSPADLENLRKNRPEELEQLLEKQAGPESVKPLYTITKANMAQYNDQLTEGHKALLNKYPTYKMVVYKSIRTAFYPDEINKATVANASSATLEGTDTLKGAKLGFPFPIPKSGAEVIWNHKLKFRGSTAKRYNNQAIVKPDGSYTITKLTEDVKFKYANLKEPNWNGKVYTMYLSEVISPPRVAGQITLVHETSDISVGGGRIAYIYSPGLGRVNRAPDVGYDNPAISTDNEQATDQIDVFNGALDRYNWKLVGKKEMLIPYNSYRINSPKVKYKDILKAFHINQDLSRYELHRVWVVEATLKPGLRHIFAKRTFYVDEDSWSIAVVDCYDGRGSMFKVQEAHLFTAPFIPTVTGVPELIYDLTSNRYFATALANEDAITDFRISFDDSYFDPANLKRKARAR